MSARLRKKRAQRDNAFLSNNGPGCYIIKHEKWKYGSMFDIYFILYMRQSKDDSALYS